MNQSEVGLIGLGTMGSNLARNIAGKNIHIALYNRTESKTKKFIKHYGNEFLHSTKDVQEFISSLAIPRKIMIFVEAGKPVDEVIEQLKPSLTPGDIIIDCGNSFYQDTQRRYNELKTAGFHFWGCGVSGGEKGALEGPSLMPGGDTETWPLLEPLFKKIAAKDFSGEPCVTYTGDNAAGHYVKMVHNGIEYGLMQLIAETYDILRRLYKLPPTSIAEIFRSMNQGTLQSYLLSISATVLSQEDTYQKGFLIDYILDKANQKGTGAWTALEALERDTACPTITEAVFSRSISANKDLRNRLSTQYSAVINMDGEENPPKIDIELEDFIVILKDALHAATICTYAQGFALISEASRENNWNICLSEITRIWQGGCIIRSMILHVIHTAFKNLQDHMHLLEMTEIQSLLIKDIPKLREIIVLSSINHIPIPSFSATLSYFDSITNNKLPANFIQGMRDYFGAHTYERIDKKGIFHTHWEQ